MATISNKGFMSADLYKYSVKSFYITGTQMAKLYTKSNTNWIRKGGLVCFSNENGTWLYSFCIVERTDSPMKIQVSRIYGDDSNIEFYQKNYELYAYYKSGTENNISVIGFSGENIELSKNKLDDTFTKVEIS